MGAVIAPKALRLCVAALLAGLPLACSGPPVPSPVDGEPICGDFEVGATHAKMRGGLRFPVRLSIAEGKTPVMKTTIVGLRVASDTPTRILLPDTDGEFSIEWAQCENERATRPIEASKDPRKEAMHEREAKDATAYECGTATVYKTESIKTRKHDIGSHALSFAAPPKLDCWQSEAPVVQAMDAGVPAPPASVEPVADAAAPPASASASAAPSSSAKPSKPQ